MSDEVCKIILNGDVGVGVGASAGAGLESGDIQGGAPNVKVLNPWNLRNKEIQPQDAIAILKKYGWKGRFKDFGLFAQACVHTSYVDKPDGCSGAEARELPGVAEKGQ
jgi:hypothetical protein